MRDSGAPGYFCRRVNSRCTVLSSATKRVNKSGKRFEQGTNVSKEFEEIGHSGGKITFRIVTDPGGRRAFQVTISSDRPVPTVWIGVYALPQGVPVESIQLGGIGQLWNPAPFPGCWPVMIASDSEGKFGHNCPSCRAYWRSGPWPNICPYCRVKAAGYQFLSEAQHRY